MCDRQLYYTQTENIKRLDQRVVSECTVQMLSVLVVSTVYLPRNVAHAHVLQS